LKIDEIMNCPQADSTVLNFADAFISLNIVRITQPMLLQIYLSNNYT